VRLGDFDYELPAELIAQAPAERRDASRLLVVGGGDTAIAHRQFTDLPDLLPEGALLVVNDARVLPARLHTTKPTGGAIEVFLVEPTDEPGVWECLVRGKVAPGVPLTLKNGQTISLTAPGRVQIGDLDLEAAGEIPLPPYIDRAPRPEDRERYQTIFARTPGAVAAPTAGLHFTDEILARLSARGIERRTVTLFVGPGTFAPIKEDDVDKHVMHAERYAIPDETALAHEKARAERRPIVAVGTTVVRALESAFDGARVKPGAGETRLFIRPGYTFRTIDRLVTNFHMPRSTLLLLVCAFAGRERLLAAYREAVRERYRFFSYGDACLL
jgi:S-adenosylmethionine:tRNA ribosyltransferase-isomerase